MIILIPITLLYGVFAIVGLYNIWSKRVEPKPIELPKGVSLVVALRNESENIDRLIYSVLNQKTSFPIELLMVDDNSSDNTFELLSNWASKYKMIKVISNPLEGKKSAVKSGVEKAIYPIVIQTDADCEMGEFWVMSSINRMLSGKSDLILGPVYPFKTKGLLNGLIRLEWLAMQFITALTARFKNPGMANGANLIFYKDDYLTFYSSEYGKKFASGDDMFFLRFLQKKGKKIGFNLDQKAIVYTAMPTSLKSLLKQRIRWATKAGKTTNALTYFFTLIVAMANFAWIGAIFSVVNDFRTLPILIIAIGWKLTTDFMISWNMARFYKDSKVLIYVPLMFLIYPGYLLLGLLFSFKKTYSWKGRSVS
mgnify:CR=1 FL=1|tara:strand:+ start:739 stop:1836 length:1098 start_codon:yes stop_codon:yes gene_type:complete